MANGLFNLKQVMQSIQQGGWNGQKPPAVEYLVVAGGGGGGQNSNSGGGGGAGGLLQGIDPVPNGQTLLVTVGGGGSGGSSATAGSNSVFGSITSIGGGQGGNNVNSSARNGSSGGSGGGGGAYSIPGIGGQGTFGQGNAGGMGYDTAYQPAGGGGGAGTKGLDGLSTGYNPGAGGSGIATTISGTTVAYAGGGGGGTNTSSGGGSGGVGGGGNGATSSSSPAAGTANTGGGGGGGGGSSGTPSSGAAGGSGIVILSYPDTYAAPTATTGGPTVSTSGSGSISFTGSTSVYLSTATNTSSFAFGTGDFTVEFWLYVNSSGGTYTVYDGRALGVNDLSPTIFLSSGNISYYTNGSTAINGAFLGATTWYHIAVCRTGTSTKLYVNGTQSGSTYTDSNNYINTSSRPFIGSGSIVVGQNPLNGYMTNIRIVKGVCVYTGTFTPPTNPLTATQPAGTNIAAITGTSTSLLLNSVSGGYLADSSTLANTFSVSTAPAWNQLSPFTGTGYKNRVYTWTSSGSITF